MRKYIDCVEKLNETPIEQWSISPYFLDRAKAQEEKATDENPIHWSKIDKAVITEPNRIEKVKTAFNECPFKFNVLFYHTNKDDPSTYWFSGEINDQLLDSLDDPKITQYIKHWERPDCINFILTNNVSNSPVSLASGWMLAHRIGHSFGFLKPNLSSLLLNGTKKIFQTCYSVENNKNFYNLMIKLCTMRSARTNNLIYSEINSELVAQFVIKGKISLITEAPHSIVIDDINYPLKNIELFNSMISDLESKLNEAAYNLLSSCVGKSFMD